MDINNLEYPYPSFIQTLIHNPLNHPLTFVKRTIGYAQQGIYLHDFQTTKYPINELTEFVDAYISNYFAQGTSETHKKLYCLNLTEQQEREYKAQQKKNSQNNLRLEIHRIITRFSQNEHNFLHNFPQFRTHESNTNTV